MAKSSSQNPVIDQSGTASIESGQFCLWETANGSSSTITIGNSSRSNTAKVGITGIPDGVIAEFDGKPVSPNGFVNIPPNSPNEVYRAIGDFQGANVTIVNMTSSQNDADVSIQAQTTKSMAFVKV
jgi:hypothetical protein